MMNYFYLLFCWHRGRQSSLRGTALLGFKQVKVKKTRQYLTIDNKTISFMLGFHKNKEILILDYNLILIIFFLNLYFDAGVLIRTFHNHIISCSFFYELNFFHCYATDTHFNFGD